GRLVAKERGDVDEDRVEELHELLGMHLEVLDIALVVLDAHHLHAPLHASLEARPLVAGEVEAALLLEKLEQGLELVVRRFSHASGKQSFCSAGPISSSVSTKSAMPVACAASGMPANSAFFASCTITVPPIFLMAFTPIAPSEPLPESTTAMARSLKLAAVDSNSRSAEGRTKCTSRVCVREMLRSGLTSRCRLGGATWARPGRSSSPSTASLTGSAVRRLRMSAIRLRWRGSRCCPTTSAAGKSAGSAGRMCVSALRPPADAA